jgi:pimeloyl-ACP methyl ester carboxylesterase
LCAASALLVPCLLALAIAPAAVAAYGKPAPSRQPASPAPADTLRPSPGMSPRDAVPDTATVPPREDRGEREIVLIHALGSSAAEWNEVVPILTRAYHVWSYELPGHGTTPPIHNLTIKTASQDLGAYLKRHDVARPVLVGHAMGGLIAMQYAFDHPADVKKLILIDATPKQLATEAQKEAATEELLHNYDRFVAEMCLQMSPYQDIGRRIVDQALKTDRASFTSLLMSSFRFDLTSELSRQAIPILVIGSQLFFPAQSPDSTRIALDRMGFAMARTISFKRMEKTGHYPMLEQPQYLASVIAAYSQD